jgi:hypothetical protein
VLLARVASIHGVAGVFAVAGYRMGERALHDLGEQRGSFAIDVTYRTPLKVQYSCIADGRQAATWEIERNRVATGNDLSADRGLRSIPNESNLPNHRPIAWNVPSG